ncbi:MAG: hypothetical protein EBW65_09565 [Gammaproteobacteria bacterium]|nr:hypothetical protein [Gammaproteobacteria bacterium]
MDKEVIEKCVAEYERRYRLRTPPKEIQDVLPHSRVLKAEIREWAFEEGLIKQAEQSELLICIDFYEALGKCLKRLKKEFGE